MPIKICVPADGMFQTEFRGDLCEFSDLLDYFRFIAEERVVERLADSVYGPSSTWRDWARKTFIGFSTGGVLVQSGHNFSVSQPVSWRKRVRLPFQHRRSPPNYAAMFKRYYPDFLTPAAHAPLAEVHPVVYFRTAEAVILSNVTPKRILEVGAGAGVHILFRHLLNTSLHSVVIDLPETIPVAYCLIRALAEKIDIALPHQNHNASIRFLLPFQDPGDGFDFAFNMASFQEMEIETVNAYLALFRERLLQGGTIQSVNLRCSKQHTETRLEAYDFGAAPHLDSTPFHDELSGGRFKHVSAVVKL